MSSKVVKFAYKSIMDELLIKEDGYYKIENAFIENGIVFIQGRIKATGGGVKESTILPSKYAPRNLTICNVDFPSTHSDVGKINALIVTTAGVLSCWHEGLSIIERFSVMYPLKSS